MRLKIKSSCPAAPCSAARRRRADFSHYRNLQLYGHISLHPPLLRRLRLERSGQLRRTPLSSLFARAIRLPLRLLWRLVPLLPPLLGRGRALRLLLRPRVLLLLPARLLRQKVLAALELRVDLPWRRRRREGCTLAPPSSLLLWPLVVGLNAGEAVPRLGRQVRVLRARGGSSSP